MMAQLRTRPPRPQPRSFVPVHRPLLQRKCACSGTPGPIGECEACHKKRLQLKGNGAGTQTQNTSAVPAIVHEVLRSPGQPLDAETRAFMEPRFGHDFSDVRIHTDARAAESAQSVNALAYTVGPNVVFGARQFAPCRSGGEKLLAHELTHVIQQRSANTMPVLELGPIEDSAEREANRLETTIARGDLSRQVADIKYPVPIRTLQRRPARDESVPRKHKVTKGETLTQIAAAFGVSVQELKRANGKKLKRWPAKTGPKTSPRFVWGFNAGEEIIIPPTQESSNVKPQGRGTEPTLGVPGEVKKAGVGEEYVPVPRESTLSLIREDDLLRGFSDQDLQVAEAAKGTQAASDLAPSLTTRNGSKDLKKGRMEWTLTPIASKGEGGPAARIQIAYTAKPVYRSGTVTFLQTVLTTNADTIAAPSGRTLVDLRTDIEEMEPFYGADWDPGKNAWIAESVNTPVPAGFKNSPNSNTEVGAYLFDEPVLYPGMGKIFESVAVIPETAEILGSLRWGVAKDELLGARSDDCTDLPSAGFSAAMSAFYTMPEGSDLPDPGRFEAIIDGYGVDNFELGIGNQERLDPIIRKFLNYPTMRIAVSGFADASEDDPNFTSLMRASIVQRYMMSEGVPQNSIDVHSFGAAWARFPPTPSEARNRRVQIRTYYKAR